MIFDLIELQKTLTEADFTIHRGDTELGHAHLTGSLSSMDGKWTMQFMGNTLTIAPGKTALRSAPAKVKPFRPYDIMMNGAAVGTVYQTKSNDGFLKSFDFHQLYLNGGFYDMFPIHFGDEGQKTPVYFGDQQIAEVHKAAVVRNDLHSYHILAKDEGAALPCVLLCTYMFVNAAFRPGVEVTTSEKRVHSVTTNKLLLAKYHPEFAGTIEQ